jgi:hypothetical protein
VQERLSRKAEFWTNIQSLSPEGIKSLIFGKKVKRKKIDHAL